MRRSLFLLSLMFLFSCVGERNVVSIGEERKGEIFARRKIFIVHSYHDTYDWVVELNRGMKDALDKSGYNVDVSYFYMDTKRHPDEAYMDSVGDVAVEMIKRGNPDVVIACDDNAQRYVVSKLLDTDYKFVFVGVNADPREYGYINSLERPGHNVTGVLERENFRFAMENLRKLVPDIKTIAIISDSSNTSYPVVERVKKKAHDMKIKVYRAYRTNSFKRWQKYVKEVQGKVDAICIVTYHTIRDDRGEYVEPHRVIDWTVKNSKLPEFGFWNFLVKDGGLFAYAISGYYSGYIAMEIAINLFTVWNPAIVPVRAIKIGEVWINRDRAEELNITIPEEVKKYAHLYPEEE